MTDLEHLLSKPLARIDDAGFSTALVKRIIAQDYKKRLIMAAFYAVLLLSFAFLLPLGDLLSTFIELVGEIASTSGAEITSVASSSSAASSLTFGALKSQINHLATDLNILLAFLVIGFIGFLITAES